MLRACVGVVIVSTPQDVALRDTLKGISMFQKMNVPVCDQTASILTFGSSHS